MQVLFCDGCFGDEGGWRWLGPHARIVIRGVPSTGVIFRATARTSAEIVGDGVDQQVDVTVDGLPVMSRMLLGVERELALAIPVAGGRDIAEIEIRSSRSAVPGGSPCALSIFLQDVRADGALHVLFGGPDIPAEEPCDICGSFADRLIASPRFLREGLACRECWATSRDRSYISALGRCLGVEGPLSAWPTMGNVRVLEASGMRAHPPRMAGRFAYVNTQFQHALPQSARGFDGPFANLEQLPFAADVFDVVMSSDVFEHVRQHRRALAEIYRVLKPSGTALIQLPWSPWRPDTVVRVQPIGDVDHYRMPAEYHADEALVYREFGGELVQEIEDCGFDVQLLKDHQRAWLLPSEQEFVIQARKPRGTDRGGMGVAQPEGR